MTLDQDLDYSLSLATSHINTRLRSLVSGPSASKSRPTAFPNEVTHPSATDHSPSIVFMEPAEINEPEVKVPSAKQEVQLGRPGELRAGIVVLPIEILSAVFRLACSERPLFCEYGFQEFNRESDPPGISLAISSALALSAVSQHWRQVALSLPELWQYLRVSPKPIGYRYLESWANLLRLCIRRSPSSIELLIDYCAGGNEHTGAMTHPADPELILDHVEWTAFVEFPHVIKGLSLKMCSGTSWWPDLVDILAPLTRLERLRLHWAGGIQEEIDIGALKFHDLAMRLTTLDITHFPYDQSLNLLYLLPNLIHFRCYQPFTPDYVVVNDGIQVDHYRDESRKALNIEWLEWPAMFLPETLHFASISTPALRGLRWQHLLPHAEAEHLISRIDAAFAQFMSTAVMLTELDLTPGTASSNPTTRTQDLLSQIFQQLPNLMNLTLRASHFQLSLFSSTLIDPIMAHSSVVPLPSLRALTFYRFSPPSCVGPRRPKFTVATRVLELLRQRSELGLVRRFDVSFNFPCEWEDEVRNGYRELAREGLNLGVYVESEPVEWLHSTK
ncbi:hypothetical protein NP233_g6788 [Leucocoprinus birnbaumii]|uniref:F-box domain-containing protein n=1 Tax=Leucocoprinus birnbaumii TaxID=56174 RepID=A0AAD5VRH6_9AGAR|nr:hypothetical protein NP233_g6788 [Leucocoprinus birnbaumii]